jgi:lipoprotein-anchoring transpeptidase ErfK/SrfK
MARVRSALFAVCVATAVFATTAPAYAAAPPTAVTGLAPHPADAQVGLTWTNPADADFKDVTVVQKTGSTPPATIADGLNRYRGTGQSTVVTGLTNGTTYSFAVFTRNTADDVSAPASVTSAPVPALATTLTGVASAGIVTYGRPVTLTATLRRTDNDQVLSDEPVDVYRKVYGQSSFTRVYRLRTGAGGVATYRSLGLSRNTEWYLSHPPNPFLGDSQTATITTLVRPAVGVRISRQVVEQNAPAVVTVTVAPSHAGQLVHLQQWTSKGWNTVAHRELTSASTATFAIVSNVLGTRVFRIAKSADADHTGVVTTKFGVTVVPRTLRSGMSGADVGDVQRRLAALHYDVGSANGFFGFDTVHATAAFQKVNRLPVTGMVDPRTFARLASPVAPPLRHKQSGSWVEVDLTRQVLYYGRGNAVLRILDVSSGSGKLFTVQGQTQRAVTPVGSFKVFHKIDGLRTSRLGELWRPAYFASGGYAIHGNGSVPFTPASHGCIRITVPAMNRLFAMLTIGLPVYVYRS